MTTKYKAYRNGVEVATELNEAKYNHTGLTPNTEYSFQFQAYNEAGDSGLSPELKVKTLPISVTGVTITPKTLSLVEGGQGKLNHTVAPENATTKGVTYTSATPAVATVNNTGDVTAVKPGTAVITVKTNDGNKTDTATVTVTAKPKPVTGITIAPKTASVDVGAKVKLTHTIAPADADVKTVTFKTDKPTIATVTGSGEVTGVTEGTAIITVTTTDGSKTDTSTITVNAVVVPEPEE